MNKEFIYNIDIIGSCNLRCPSCPVGNMKVKNRYRGLMDIILFEEIIKKAKKETPNISYVNLVNWAEPFLHPKLPEFIKILNKYELNSVISTNFNKSDNLFEIIKANPSQLYISLSGFYQNTYSKTHKNGNIEVVKENMFKLSEIMNILNSKSSVSVIYHKYNHNMGEDFERMSSLCMELGFFFFHRCALLLPLEKLLDYYEDKKRLSEQDNELINLLLINPDEFKNHFLKYKKTDCSLRSNQMTLNSDGSVALCCATYFSNISDNFLNLSFEKLQKRKYSSEICKTCMKYAIHLTYTTGSEEISHFIKTPENPNNILN